MIGHTNAEGKGSVVSDMFYIYVNYQSTKAPTNWKLYLNDELVKEISNSRFNTVHCLAVIPSDMDSVEIKQVITGGNHPGTFTKTATLTHSSDINKISWDASSSSPSAVNLSYATSNSLSAQTYQKFILGGGGGV